MKERVLVVAAHPDDEAFGCLQALLDHKSRGAEFSFVWFTKGRNNRSYDGAFLACKYFNAYCTHSSYFSDQKLDTYPLVDLVTVVESAVASFKPTTCYIPFIGDLNKDHRLVSEACMVAMRPCKKGAPPTVTMYQIKGSTEYGFIEFHKDVFIEGYVDKKEKLIKKWYPKEMINGREEIQAIEWFERWPR